MLTRLALRNIRRHLRYSIGAFLSVMTGFIALCLFRAYIADVDWLYQDTYSHRNMYGQLMIERAVSAAEKRQDPWLATMDLDAQRFIDEKLAAFPARIKRRVRFLMASGTVANSRSSAPFYAKAYDVPEGVAVRGETWEWDTAAGLPLHKAKSADAIVVGRGLAEALGCQVPRNRRIFSKYGGYSSEPRPFACPDYGVQIEGSTVEGQSNLVNAEISGIVDGIFKELDERFVMMPLAMMQRLFDTTAVSYISLQFEDKPTALHFLSVLRSDPRMARLKLRSLTWQESEDGDIYRRTMELLGIFQGFVVSIFVAITGLSVFNTFLKAVKERTREIGTMRSFGFRRAQILALFVSEAMVLAGIGVLAGAVISFSVTVILNSIGVLYKAGLLSEPVPFRLSYDWVSYASSGAFLMSIAGIAAVFAAASTTSRPVADNLSRV